MHVVGRTRRPVTAEEYARLRADAYAAHSVALKAAGPRTMMTADMCNCGMGTGSYKVSACKALDEVRIPIPADVDASGNDFDTEAESYRLRFMGWGLSGESGLEDLEFARAEAVRVLAVKFGREFAAPSTWSDLKDFLEGAFAAIDQNYQEWDGVSRRP